MPERSVFFGHTKEDLCPLQRPLHVIHCWFLVNHINMLSTSILASAGKLISFKDMQAEKEQLSPHYFYSFAYGEKNPSVSITGTFAFANQIGNYFFFCHFESSSLYISPRSSLQSIRHWEQYTEVHMAHCFRGFVMGVGGRALTLILLVSSLCGV